MFLAITWKGKAELDPREGWVIQPSYRVRGFKNRTLCWKYEKPIAGPFRTKKIAQQVKKLFMEHDEWWR